MKELSTDELRKLGARNLEYVYNSPIKTDYKDYRPKEQSVKINVKKLNSCGKEREDGQAEDNTEISSADLIDID